MGAPSVLRTLAWAADGMHVTPGPDGRMMAWEGQEFQLSECFARLSPTPGAFPEWGEPGGTRRARLPLPRTGHLGPSGCSRALPLGTHCGWGGWAGWGPH